MQTRREKVRNAAIDEIKTIAWDIAETGSIEDVTINGIARQMGMTPPAFYSYFKNRAELIKALVIDSYRSFQEALTTVADQRPDSDSAGRLYHVFIAYREWAVANPSKFRLFAGRLVQGFEDQDAEIIAESDKGVRIWLNLFNDAWLNGAIKKPHLNLAMSGKYEKIINTFHARYQMDTPLEITDLALKLITQTHGIISLELSGRLSHFLGDTFLFYQHHILSYMKQLGIDYTP